MAPRGCLALASSTPQTGALCTAPTRAALSPQSMEMNGGVLAVRQSSLGRSALPLRTWPAALAAPHQRRMSVTRAIFNPQDDPILKQAIKEPVAFVGGLVAGLLRLDLREEPLKEWVERTSQAAGLDLKKENQPQPGEDLDVVVVDDDTGPTEITIE